MDSDSICFDEDELPRNQTLIRIGVDDNDADVAEEAYPTPAAQQGTQQQKKKPIKLTTEESIRIISNWQNNKQYGDQESQLVTQQIVKDISNNFFETIQQDKLQNKERLLTRIRSLKKDEFQKWKSHVELALKSNESITKKRRSNVEGKLEKKKRINKTSSEDSNILDISKADEDAEATAGLKDSEAAETDVEGYVVEQDPVEMKNRTPVVSPKKVKKLKRTSGELKISHFFKGNAGLEEESLYKDNGRESPQKHVEIHDHDTIIVDVERDIIASIIENVSESGCLCLVDLDSFITFIKNCNNRLASFQNIRDVLTTQDLDEDFEILIPLATNNPTEFAESIPLDNEMHCCRYFEHTFDVLNALEINKIENLFKSGEFEINSRQTTAFDDQYDKLISYRTDPNNDILLFVKHFDKYKVVVLFRCVENTLRSSFLFMVPEEESREEMEVQLSQPTYTRLKFELRITTGNQVYVENEDAIVELPLTVSLLKERFRSSFAKLENENDFEIMCNEEIISNDNQLENNLEGVIFRVNKIEKDVELKQNEYSIPIHFTQRTVAVHMLKNAKSILNFKGKLFNSFDFLIFVPRYNSLRQQTIDRLSQFGHLVHGLSESEIAEHVLLYPVQTKHTKSMEKFSNDVKSNNDTLFVVIVDECHFAPTKTAIPLLHDDEIRNRSNVLIILVSATPWNALSNQSAIVSSSDEHVVDWTTVARACSKDCYVGFEYYARSIVFTCPSNLKLHISLNDDKKSIDLANLTYKEYASYTAFLEDVNLAMWSEIPELTGSKMFTWEKTEDRVTFTFSRSLLKKIRSFEIKSTRFLQLLGFSQDIVVKTESFKQLSSNYKATAESSLKIDDNFTVHHQLIRTDSSFNTLKHELIDNFSYLSRTRGGGVDDEEAGVDNSTKKKKKRVDCCLPKKPMALELFDGIVKYDYRMLSGEPAEARNGFTIIIDYIMSICCYALNLTLSNVKSEGDISDELLATFHSYLLKSCYFCDAENKEVFNLTHVMNYYLNRIKQEAVVEIKKRNERRGIISRTISNREVLQYYLFKKVEGFEERETSSDSESWYTETDRIVHMLMTNPFNGFQSSQSSIVLLRCYDNDENRSMQKVVRNCLMQCGKKDVFSVIGDISNTKLLEVIEFKFREECYVNHHTFGKCRLIDIPKLRSKAIQASSQLKEKGNNQQVNIITDDLKYEDLHGIPCLFILCEKGRMGDTFPHSLSALDLRLRTCRAGSGFIQELGRMCRYPKCRPPTEKVTKLDLISRMHQRLLAFDHGFFLISEGGSNLGLARTEQQLMQMLDIVPDETSAFSLCYLEERLPYALIEESYLADIEKAIDSRENAIQKSIENDFDDDNMAQSFERKREHNRIINHLKFRYGLDDYLNQAVKQAGQDFSYQLSKSKSHYDSGNKTAGKHERRMILKAECQIGKTGAFLAFLYYLKSEICSCNSFLPQVQVTLSESLQRRGMKGFQWYYPYWENMKQQPLIEYSWPQTGKYASKVLEFRAAILNEARHKSSSDSAMIVKAYQQKLVDEECLTLLGEHKLHELVTKTMCSSQGLQPEAMSKLINWDGRMSKMKEDLEKYSREIVHGRSHMLSADAVNLMQFWNKSQSDEEFEEGEDDEDVDSGFGDVEDGDVDDGEEADYSAKSLLACPPAASSSSSSEYIPLNFRLATGTLVNMYVPVAATAGGKNGPLTTVSDLMNILKPQIIKKWIFTPTYFNRSSIGDKLLCRDDCFEHLTKWADYCQVLVIRESQKATYLKYFSSSYIILCMPDRMNANDLYTVDQDKRYSDKSYDADKGGIGLVRRFTQYCASVILKLDAIWFLDDNIQHCYRLSIPCEPQDVEVEKLRYHKTSFAIVMRSIEGLLAPQPLLGQDAEVLMRLGGVVTKAPLNEPNRLSFSQTKPSLGKNIESLRDYTGDADCYGIIGISRVPYLKRSIKEPIKVTHAIYSFFLLNLKKCEELKVYYPPRPVWEDVEMNHLLEAKGAVCCKMQVFSHYKPVHGLRMPPRKQKTLYDFDVNEFYNFFRESRNVDDDIFDGALSELKAAYGLTPVKYFVVLVYVSILNVEQFKQLLTFLSSKEEIMTHAHVLLVLSAAHCNLEEVSPPFNYDVPLTFVTYMVAEKRMQGSYGFIELRLTKKT